jgi:hypothetical protein
MARGEPMGHTLPALKMCLYIAIYRSDLTARAPLLKNAAIISPVIISV